MSQRGLPILRRRLRPKLLVRRFLFRLAQRFELLDPKPRLFQISRRRSRFVRVVAPLEERSQIVERRVDRRRRRKREKERFVLRTLGRLDLRDRRFNFVLRVQQSGSLDGVGVFAQRPRSAEQNAEQQRRRDRRSAPLAPRRPSLFANRLRPRRRARQRRLQLLPFSNVFPRDARPAKRREKEKIRRKINAEISRRR